MSLQPEVLHDRVELVDKALHPFQLQYRSTTRTAEASHRIVQSSRRVLAGVRNVRQAPLRAGKAFAPKQEVGSVPSNWTNRGVPVFPEDPTMVELEKKGSATR